MQVTTEVLINPLSRIISRVGEAVAQAQRSLDENSIRTQLELEENREALGGYDLQAAWYHLPEVEVEMKMALTMHLEAEKDRKGRIRGYRPVLHGAPLNATYANTYNYDVRGTSKIRARIVSLPPPGEIKRE